MFFFEFGVYLGWLDVVIFDEVVVYVKYLFVGFGVGFGVYDYFVGGGEGVGG